MQFSDESQTDETQIHGRDDKSQNQGHLAAVHEKAILELADQIGQILGRQLDEQQAKKSQSHRGE